MKSGRWKIISNSWWFITLVTVFLALSVRSAIADWNDVPTGSMKPTILEGDRIYVNKLAYDLKIPFTTLHIATWADPERGDIVVFRSPLDGKRLVKRVVGLPGDVISMKSNRLWINGQPTHYEQTADPLVWQEPGIAYFNEVLAGHEHWIQIIPSRRTMSTFGPVTVPEGFYLMLGDNRNKSADSRVFGLVPRGNILGRATAVVASLDINGGYAPRWKRFLSKLN